MSKKLESASEYEVRISHLEDEVERQMIVINDLTEKLSKIQRKIEQLWIGV